MSRVSCPRCERDALLIEALTERVQALEARRYYIATALSKARADRDLWKARAKRYRERTRA